MMSGMYYHKEEILRFLTLTTAPGMNYSLEKCWKLFYLRLKRVRPIDFVKGGWLTLDYVENIFNITEDWELFEPLSYFVYIKIVTSEGVTGVYHILYFGHYYPAYWLSEQWEDITGTAYHIDIQQCKGAVYDSEKLAKYCVNQYVAGQPEFERYSTSKGWCFKGYIDVWNNIKRRNRYERDKPIVHMDFEVKYWYDMKAVVNSFQSWVDDIKGVGVGQRRIDDYDGNSNYFKNFYNVEKNENGVG